MSPSKWSLSTGCYRLKMVELFFVEAWVERKRPTDDATAGTAPL